MTENGVIMTHIVLLAVALTAAFYSNDPALGVCITASAVYLK